MNPIPPGMLSATGLLGGYAIVRTTHHRHWGGGFTIVVGMAALESCRRRTGLARASLLGSIYFGALAGSHPLAKKIGAWPSVLSVTAVTAAASSVLSRKQHSRVLAK